MRLTKEEFCSCVDNLRIMHDRLCKIEDALNISPESTISDFFNNYYDLVDKLCELPENDIYGNDLSYYCWELDFGRNKAEDSIILDGNPFSCKTPEDLWELIKLEQKAEAEKDK